MGNSLRPETLGQPASDPSASLPGVPSGATLQQMLSSFPVSLADIQGTNQQLQAIQGNHVTQAAGQIQQMVQPTPPPTTGSAIQQTAAQQMQNASDDVFSQISRMGSAELQGRAQALGIDNPGAYSDQQLQQYIVQQRAQVRPDHAGFLASVLAPFAEAGTTIANMGLQIGGQVENLRNELWGIKATTNALGLPDTDSNASASAPPYINDVLEHGINRQQAQAWLANLDEGTRASLTPAQNQMLGGFGALASAAGGMALAGPIFEGASALLSIPIAGSETGLIASPIARSAVAGAATALGLYSGSDVPMLPSSKDFSTMLDGSAATPDRVAAAMNVIGGNRLIGSILGGALGTLGAKGKQAFPDGTDLGEGMSNDPANDPTVPAAPQRTLGPSVVGTAYDESWAPQAAGTAWAGAPQGTPAEAPAPNFNNFRALPAGSGETVPVPTGGIEGVDWQIEPREQPQTNAYGQRLLRPPLQPGAQSAVDFASTAIGDAYRAVGMNEDPRIQDILIQHADADATAYGNTIQNISNNPANWDRRAPVQNAGDWTAAGNIDMRTPVALAPTDAVTFNGTLYHAGDYAGGTGNPDLSITGQVGTHGSGLYFATRPEDIAGLSPSMQFGRTVPINRFQPSSLSLLDMNAPPSSAVLNQIRTNSLDPDNEFAGALTRGEITTNRDIQRFGMDYDDNLGQLDSFNELAKDAGYHGLLGDGEVTVFPGYEHLVGNAISDAAATATQPTTQTRPLQLTGPLDAGTQLAVDGYNAQANLLEDQHQAAIRNGLPPEGSIGFQNQIDSYRNAAFELANNPSNRLTSSPQDVSGQIANLRIQQAYLQTRLDNNVGDVNDTDLIDKTYDIDQQIAGLMKSAGIPPRQEPNLWDVIKDNPQSPVTPGRQVVDNYGTIIRNPDGAPAVLYHATASQFSDFDVSMTNPAGLGGSGIYVTNNPMVAGGDPGNPTSTYGYGTARANDLLSQKVELKYQRDAAQATVNNFEAQGPASGINPQAYQLAKQTINNYPAALAAIPDPAPNVHMVYAAIKKPFDFDGHINMEDGLRILQTAADNPVFGSRQLDWGKVAETFKNQFIDGNSYHGPSDVFGHDLYYGMLGASPVEQDPSSHFISGSEMTKDMNNEVLQDAGYDAIKFDGGNRNKSAGGMQHNAYNIFDPKHIVPVYLSEPQAAEAAEKLGTTLYKKEIIQQTTALPELVAKSAITDADVVKAEVTANPGGFHLIRSISNMPALMQGLQEQLQGGMIKAFRPVVGPSGSTDLLVSSLGELTDKLATDYTKWGLFPNQDVISASGKEGKVVRLDDNNHVWRSSRQRGKQVSNAYPGTLTPKTSGVAVIEAEPLWQQFRQYAVDQTAARINSSGQPYTPENGIFDLPVQERLQNLTTTFLNEAKISDAGTRAAIQRYFDNRMIDESKTLAPDAWAKHDAIAEMSAAADPIAEANDRVPDIYAHGALRGFNVVPNEGKPGYMLEDIISDRKIPFNDEEGVRNFLNTYNRQMPDITPFSPVPLEAGDWSNDSMMHQTEMHADDWEEQMTKDIQGMLNNPIELHVGDDGSVHQVAVTGPVQDVPFMMAGTNLAEAETGFTSTAGTNVTRAPGVNFTLPARTDLVGTGGAALDLSGHESAGGGFGISGGGNGGSGPPTAIAGGSDAPYEPDDSKGEWNIPLADVRAELANMEPHDVTQLMRIHQNLIMRVLSPMRNVMARMEEQFYQHQVGSVRPYDTFHRITSGLDMAHNDYQPTIKKTAQQLSYIDVKKLRRGGAFRIMEISDPASRIQEAIKQGWSPTEVAKLGQAINTLKSYIGKDAYAQVMQFVQRTRTMQAKGDFSTAPYGNASDFPLAAFFRDHAIDTRMNFQTVDPRNLFRAVARSYGFAKIVGQDWNEARARYMGIAQTPDSMGGRAFAAPAKIVLDWLDYVQRGPKPGSDAIQNGLQQAFGAIGIRLRTSEVRGFLGNMIGEFWLAKLAFRPDIVFRDGFTPALAIPYVGVGNLATSMAKSIAFGSEARAQIMQNALDYGFVQVGTHRIDAPSTHGQMPLLDSRGIPVDPNFDVPDMSRRASIANVGDFLRDLRPAPLRGKVTPNTMGGADAVWNWGRVIAGDAALNHFDQQVAAFTAARDAAVKSGNLAAMPSSAALMHSLNADAFMPATTRSIQRLVDAGDIQAAKIRYAQIVVNESQFTYGAIHAPQAIRGTFARMAYVGGTWSQQQMSSLFKAVKYGYKSRNLGVLASTLAIMAGHDALMEFLKKTTGWNFRKWELWSAATYGGGAIISAGASAINYIQAAQGIAASQGPQDLATGAGLDDPRRGDLETLDHVNVPRAVLGATLNTFNRFKGLEGLAGSLYDASGAARPGEATADALITGERYPASVQSQFDFEQQLKNAPPGGIFGGSNQGSVVPAIKSSPIFAAPIYAPPVRGTKWGNQLPGGHAQMQVTPGAYQTPTGNNPGYGAPLQGSAEANFMGALQYIPEAQRSAAIVGFQQSQRAAGQQSSAATGKGAQ